MKNTLKIVGKVLLALVIVLVSTLLVIYVYNRIAEDIKEFIGK